MSDSSSAEMSWFDELFNGGILLPRGRPDKPRAITLLVTGPPGTGKSTLAMELCVRLARSSTPSVLGGKTLYVASEAHPPWMIQNARSFGWLKKTEQQELFEFGPVPKAAPISICTLPDVEVGRGSIFVQLRDVFGLEDKSGEQNRVDFGKLGLVVIDSLNTAKTDRAIEFERLHDRLVESGPRLIVFVLDSSPTRPVAETWEFASDIVLRLDKEYRSGYMVRTIEVVKARYQAHVWGKHQLKIYEAQDLEERPTEVPTFEVQEQRLRAHPWAEGGIFVFPSIHYVLSRYKKAPRPASHVSRSQPIGQKTVPTMPTPLPGLNALLGGGIPAGRTTALLGDRGAHKSHLGYLQALHNVVGAGNNGKSLIVSLRDDEDMTVGTLSKILPQHWPDLAQKTSVDDLLRAGTLEIAYYMPGYITPEEFFHRLLLIIYRMRKDDEQCPITLLFNSLDQIASRFPLCAEERVFIPGIIQTLAAIGVTSVFVGADTEGVDEGLKNLLSMAELIVTLKRKMFNTRKQFMKILPNAAPDSVLSREGVEQLPDRFPSTELTVVRYAGGKAAGSQGLMDFVTPESVLYGVLTHGLQFIPYLVPLAARQPV
jgi:KaiC/GvpD/RAD55 family RecA-like ATPase